MFRGSKLMDCGLNANAASDFNVQILVKPAVILEPEWATTLAAAGGCDVPVLIHHGCQPPRRRIVQSSSLGRTV
jgi:hypothetical protein